VGAPTTVAHRLCVRIEDPFQADRAGPIRARALCYNEHGGRILLLIECGTHCSHRPNGHALGLSRPAEMAPARLAR
jgi:hypothetical protein